MEAFLEDELRQRAAQDVAPAAGDNSGAHGIADGSQAGKDTAQHLVRALMRSSPASMGGG